MIIIYKLFGDENMSYLLSKVFSREYIFCAKNQRFLSYIILENFLRYGFVIKLLFHGRAFSNVPNRIDMMKQFIEMKNIYKIMV